jgi:AraC-like DNA-binding protein
MVARDGTSPFRAAARFTELVEEPPMRYLARWRMQLALSWLRKDDTIAILANRLGYESEAAFSRSFNRFIGMSPGAARLNRDSPPSKRLAIGHRLRSASEPDASLERLILCSPI